MTANPRDAIERALLADTWTTPSVDHPHPDWHRRFAPWMAALAARIALDALCPPGSRVVVSRESKPCDECAGTGNRFYEVAEGFCDCIGCGGSGVVEATTTYGLEAVAGAWWNETYARRGDLVIDDDRQDGDMPLYRLVAAVALPEETPQ